jgi:SAM-dependent methyltransferase
MEPKQFDKNEHHHRHTDASLGNQLNRRLKNGSNKNSRADRLKGRLRAFWNAQQSYWDITSSGPCVESPPRQRAATFVPTGDLVLDIACGTSANSAELKDRCRYFGVDLSIMALQQPIYPSLRLACADADQLPFCEEAFGAVIATYVLEHTVEPAKTLREMCRVVKPGGRIVLLGPAWDFPFWYPNSLRSKSESHWWRLRYTFGRCWGQFLGWLFGRLPFARVDEPDAFHSDFIYDADAVYIVWTYEVIRIMRRWGHRLIHWETDDQLLGANPAVRQFKRCLLRLPIYRRAGNTILLVFQK